MSELDPARGVDEIDAELRARASPERAAQERAYLKSDLDHLGVSVPAVRAVAMGIAARRPALGREDLLALVQALWEGRVYERRRVAVELLEMCGDRLQAADVGLVERLLREARTWALVDELAAVVVGGLVERHPELGAVLDRWAIDPRTSGSAGRRCSPCWSRSVVGAGTSPGSRGTRTVCSTRPSSSSARRSAGCCARRRGSVPTSSTAGSCRERRAPRG